MVDLKRQTQLHVLLFFSKNTFSGYYLTLISSPSNVHPFFFRRDNIFFAVTGMFLELFPVDN